MSENPRRGRQATNFTTIVPKIVDLKLSSEQIFFRKLTLGAPDFFGRVAKTAKTLVNTATIFWPIGDRRGSTVPTKRLKEQAYFSAFFGRAKYEVGGERKTLATVEDSYLPPSRVSRALARLALAFFRILSHEKQEKRLLCGRLAPWRLHS